MIHALILLCAINHISCTAESPDRQMMVSVPLITCELQSQQFAAEFVPGHRIIKIICGQRGHGR